MKATNQTKRPAFMRSALAGAVLLGLGGVASAQVPVELSVHYSCTYPLIGDQPLRADISSEMPEEQVVGEETGEFPIDVLATAMGDTWTGMDLVGGRYIEGTAIADSNLSGTNLDLDLEVPTTIPRQDIPEEPGDFEITAEGSTPSLTFTENNEGDVVITVGDINMNLIATDEQGEPVFFPNSDPDTGEFPVPCVLEEGEDNVLHTFEVVTAEEEPVIAADPEEVDFGNVQQGLDATETVTISNEGGGTLDIQNVTIGGTDAVDFTQTNDCTTLEDDETCAVEVTFFAEGENGRTATLTLESNAENDPLDIPLSGTSVPEDPEIGVTPEELDFGQVQQGTDETGTLTVSNEGGNILSIDNVTIGGDDAADFMQTNDCTTLAGDETCTVEVTFFAEGENGRSATLTIDSNATTEPSKDIPLEGVSVIPGQANKEVDPESVNFGEVIVGESDEAQVTVTNTGDAALDINDISVGGEDAGAFLADHDCVTLSQDESCTVDLEFTPQGEFVHSATLTISSTDPDTPQFDVPLSGEGIGVPDGLPFDFDLKGKTQIRASRAMVRLRGGLEGELDQDTGMFEADLDLEPTSGKFRLFRFFRMIRAEADIEFEQVEPTTGTITDDGSVESESTMHVVLTDVRMRLFGHSFSIGGGEECRTSEPVTVNLKGRNFDPEKGGNLKGIYDLPPMENCGDRNDLISQLIAGPGNRIGVKLRSDL